VSVENWKLETGNTPILFFDGVCNLCNKTVQFIIRNDKRKVFRFAPLQSERGEELLSRIEQEQGKRPESVILLYQGKYYLRSSAVLKVAELLGGKLLLLMPGYILPAFIRDAIYDAVAGRRYKWFGKQDECMIPTPELKARFLS
jgi:predicted DCC family thiol-disulfide oxidoreductase YuxK